MAEKDLALAQLANAWAETDPVGCLTNMWGTLDSEQRMRLTSQVGRELGRLGDVEVVLTLIEEHIDSEMIRSRLMLEVIRGLSNSDRPQALVDLLPHFNTGDSTQFTIQHAARQWAEVDQEGYIEWLETVEDPNVRKSAVEALVGELSERHPKRALELYAEEVVDASGGERLVWGRTILESLQATGEDPRAAIEGLPEAARESVYRDYARLFADDAPAETVTFLESQPAGREREHALQEAVSCWAGTEPEQAVAWIEGLPAGETRTYAARNLARNWARHDLESAQQWFETLPPGEPRTAAALAMAEAQARLYPESALELLRELPSGSARDRSVQESLQALADRDVAKAREFLADVVLSDEVRQQAQKRIDQAEAMQAFFGKNE